MIMWLSDFCVDLKQTVLGMENCDEFAPYVFQILAQLLEFRAVGDISPAYGAIFPALLVPTVWENHVRMCSHQFIISALSSDPPD